MDFLSQLPEGVILGLVAFAASWGGFKKALNGMDARLERIEGTTDRIEEKVGAHGERIAKLEGSKR